MTENQLLNTPQDQLIVNRIYEIRGCKVMLDRDLAELYGIETKALKQAVRRNLGRFPEDFMFELSKEEFQNWRSQNVTSNSEKMGIRHLPFAFTEYGVLMVSSVLSNERAISINIQIVRTFNHMRRALIEHSDLKFEMTKIKTRQDSQDKNIELVFSYIDELTAQKEKPRKRIGFMPDDL